jgi:hypothetical protein
MMSYSLSVPDDELQLTGGADQIDEEISKYVKF